MMQIRGHLSVADQYCPSVQEKASAYVEELNTDVKIMSMLFSHIYCCFPWQQLHDYPTKRDHGGQYVFVI